VIPFLLHRYSAYGTATSPQVINNVPDIPRESPLDFFNFNGSDNDILFPSPCSYLPTGDASRSISFFVRPDSRWTDHWIVSYGSAEPNKLFAIAFLASSFGQKISVAGYSHDITSNLSLQDGRWYHVCVTYDTATHSLKFFIDGLLDKEVITTAYNTGSSEFRFGNVSFESSYRYSGDLRRVKVYDRVLEQSEVWDLYNSGWIDCRFEIQNRDPNFSISDSNFVYMSSFTSNLVSKIDAINKSLVGTISDPGLTQPAGMWLFGGKIWIADGKDKIFYADPTSLEIEGSITGFSGSLDIRDDGTYLWVTEYTEAKIAKVDIATKTIVAHFSIGGAQPQALRKYGNFLYALCLEDTVIKKINPLTGAVVGTITGLHGPGQMIKVGAYYFVTNYYGNSLSKISVATEQVVETYTGFTSPWGLEEKNGLIYVMHESSTATVGHIYVVDINGNILATNELFETHGSLAIVNNLLWYGGHITSCVQGMKLGLENSQTDYDVTDGKVFQALCNEKTGTNCDDSVGNNDGIIEGTTTDFFKNE
jgi:hypothetical protein